MKRFVTVFATLVMGAAMFTSAMAQAKPATPAKPAIPASTAKKPATHVAVKSSGKRHAYGHVHKKTTAKKSVVAKKVVAKMSGAKKSEPVGAKPKAKHPAMRTTQTRTAQVASKSSTKVAGSGHRTVTTMKKKPVGKVKSKSPVAPKSGKVVNRR